MAAFEQQVFDFEPIKGFPYLHWKGKRPYTSTQYFPAQCKERIGEEQDGWINRLYWGDNLQVMSHLMKEFRGKIDLIYIDPPFDSKADYKRELEIRGKKIESDFSTFEEKQYADIWSNDEYLQFMYERLILIRELLSDKGSIYLHLDEKRVHYIRMILDEIFGQDKFRREIIWDITVLSGFKVQAQNWIRGHDTILYYSKYNAPVFNKLRQPHQKKYLEMFNRIDENGEPYLVAHGITRYLKDVIDKGKPFGDVWDDLSSYHIFRNKIEEVRTYDELTSLLEETKSIQNYSDVWDNIMSFQQQPTAAENYGYSTQKPEALLERIIKASSNPGDIVFDCFMGSGTTQAVAMKLGRRFIGADINLGAIQTTMKRLSALKKEIDATLQTDEKKYSSFKIFNVNNYDFFNNPVQAKDLLIEALGIQKHNTKSCYDGSKDGRMVKIMPINRIASKADISAFAANLPYSEFEKKKDKNPHDLVERFTLVCMGHEPGLKAELERQLVNYKIDVEILDILRNQAVLELKREAEADVQRDGNKLIIKNFYPMNLIQKLSLEHITVSDWKKLVDSIIIDFNYDQVEMQPLIIDIPDKNGFVKGEYEIPKDAGRIKVKITDLISESYETELE
jgi:site-specific DNA-methyltransferase (adenine-specific)/adenine-specific DNA-methyltransferase